jgi:endo-1,4-beta-mannosidase
MNIKQLSRCFINLIKYNSTNWMITWEGKKKRKESILELKVQIL